MATYAQRLAALDVIQQSGKGLVVITNPVDDVLLVKDPDSDSVPTGGAKTPVAGQAAQVTWRAWPGIDAQTAYGLGGGLVFAYQATPSFASTAGANTYASASWDPGALGLTGQMLLVDVAQSDTVDTVVPDGVSGNGLTFVEVASIGFFSVAAPFRRLTRYRAQVTAPSEGAITVDFTIGGGQTGCAMTVTSVGGAKSGADAIRQTVASVPLDANESSGLITLAAFGNPANAVHAAWAVNGSEVFTPETGWTAGTTQAYATPDVSLVATWFGGVDLTATASWTPANRWAGIASEIVAA